MEKGQVELSHGDVTEYSSDNTEVEVLPAQYMQTQKTWVGKGPILCHCNKPLHFPTT